jgi:hypothetical protein
MSKTEHLIDRILDQAAVKLSKNFDATSAHFRSILNDVMDEVKCRYIFPRGKSKGKRCGVLYCQHHAPVLAPIPITTTHAELVKPSRKCSSSRQRMRNPDPDILNATHQIYRENFGAILGDRPVFNNRIEDIYGTEEKKEYKEDPMVRAVLEQSVMEYNVDQERMKHGRPTLGRMKTRGFIHNINNKFK